MDTLTDEMDRVIESGLRKQRIWKAVGQAFYAALLLVLLTNTYLLCRLVGATEQLVGVLALKTEVRYDYIGQGHKGDLQPAGMPGATPR